MDKPNAFEVKDAGELLPLLFARMPDRSRTAVKALLGHRQVTVDGEVVTQFNHPVTPGQKVEIHRVGVVKTGPSQRLNIIHEDAHLIVIEKRAGLLSVVTGAQREMTAFGLLSDHVKKASGNNRIFVVHRLDRETSGLMMFAKSQSVQQALQKTWTESVLERTYVAVVEGQLTQPEGTITTWLTENRALVVRSSSTPNDGQKATTRYRVLKSNARFSLVELDLETGRKNQIRVHMQHMGHSVVGDPKYGSTQNPIHRLGLHAKVLAFKHPVTGAALRFECPIPSEFSRLFQRP